ncbi:hypothetical protein D0S45_02635 [Marinifilum sp. JC120]|nr:hypothetical protein D0S45_02635 [Marinifilum sp. JC120]
MSVSRSGYYDWQKRLPSEQEKRRKQIRQAARASYKESDSVYGYRKVYKDVIEAVDFYCCPETVRRILAAEGMKYHSVRKHRYSKSHRNESFALNLLSREAELTCNALDMAINNRRPTGEVLFHSDRRSQYTCTSFSSALHKHGCITSMSRRGNCWDNAVAENFFSKLKRERVNRTVYKTA